MKARSLTTVLQGLEKQQKAAPSQTECADHKGTFKPGADLAVRPLPKDTDAPLSLDVLFGRIWTPRHEEVFGVWANDATGWSHED